MRTAGRCWAALLVLGFAAGAAHPARADDSDAIAVLGVAIVALAITDVAFATNDIVQGAKEERPSNGYAVAETLVCVPQALAFNPFFVAIANLDEAKNEPAMPLLVIPTGGVTALTTHGIWRVADDSVDPVALPAVSSAVGVNATLTLNALAAAGSGELVGRPMGVAQAIFTTPSIIGGAYGAISFPEQRAAWIGLTAWSGALFLHGMASAIWDGPSDEEESPPRPPPPEVPEKPPLLVPASIRLLPGAVTDGVATVPGVLVSGMF